MCLVWGGNDNTIPFAVVRLYFSSMAQLCLTLCDPMDCSMPGIPVHHQLPESTQLMSIESVMPSNYLILCCPLLLLPSIFPSIRVFSNEPVLHIRWPKYWGFSFSISLPNEYSGLISFRDRLVGSPLLSKDSQGNIVIGFERHTTLSEGKELKYVESL